MSAVPAREEARRLLELVPDEDMGTVAHILRALTAEARDPVLKAFRNAPEDDEEWTQEDLAAWQEGKEDLAAGRGMSTEELCRRLGL